MAYNPKSLQNLRKPFQKGQVANPRGKGAGNRDRISREYLRRLADDFERFGIYAIARARRNDPLGYLRMVVALLPKEVTRTNPLEELTDDELSAMIEYLRSIVSPASH